MSVSYTHLSAVPFLRQSPRLRRIAEIAVYQQLFQLIGPCIGENIFIFFHQRLIPAVNQDCFLFSQSDQLLIIMEYGILVYQRLLCVD